MGISFRQKHGKPIFDLVTLTFHLRLWPAIPAYLRSRSTYIPKIKVIGQAVWPWECSQTDRQMHRRDRSYYMYLDHWHGRKILFTFCVMGIRYCRWIFILFFYYSAKDSFKTFLVAIRLSSGFSNPAFWWMHWGLICITFHLSLDLSVTWPRKIHVSESIVGRR